MNSRSHLVYGVFFTAASFFMLGFIVFFGSRADDSTGTAVVNNSIPTVDTVITTSSSGGSDSGGSASTGLVVSESPSTTTVYVRGQVTDLNGCEQVSTANGDWKLKMYRTAASGAGSGATCTTASNNNCYDLTESNITLSGCTAGGSDTTVDYQFIATLQSYVDATDVGSSRASDTWTSKVTMTDSASAVVSSTDLFEVGGTVALSLGSGCIDYGSLGLNATSGDVACEVSNTGNGGLGIRVYADGPMICDGTGSDSIPAASGKYFGAVDTAYADKIALSTTPTTISNFVIGHRTPSGSFAENLLFQLKVPASGVSGVCNNVVHFTAIYVDCPVDDPDCSESSGYNPGSSSSGPNSPSAGANDSSYGVTAWTNPTYVTASDGSNASALLMSTNSQYLKATGYGFSVPTGATINGIKLEVQRYGTALAGGATVKDTLVQLVNAGSVVGDSKADTGTAWPSSAAYVTYGSSTDTWGRTWTAAEINANTFGAALAATGNNMNYAYVDHMRITVYYTQ